MIRDYEVVRGIMVVFFAVAAGVLLGAFPSRLPWILVPFAIWVMLSVSFVRTAWRRRDAWIGCTVFLVGSLAVAGTLEVTSHYFLLVIAFVLGAVFLLKLALKFYTRIPSENLALLNRWSRLGQPMNEFPLSRAQREKFVLWARDKVLRPLALEVTRAFDDRDRADEQRHAAWQAYYDLRDDTTPRLPNKMAGYRRALNAAHKKACRMVDCRQYRRLSKRADEARKEYLATWDFFVKGEWDGGVGILDEFRNTDPDVFRLLATTQRPDFSGEVGQEPPPVF
jgi:hypothetical protein